MTTEKIMRSLIQLLFVTSLIIQPASAFATPVPQSAPKIELNGTLPSSKTQRGRIVRATVVMNIPAGYHINSNHPLEKFLIATHAQVEAPKGIRVGSVGYPRAVLRKFKFSKNRVSVYEGRATMTFDLTVPRNFASGPMEVKVRVRYQSCNDEVCFPPQTRDVSLWLTVEG
jgi:hypothetical protein